MKIVETALPGVMRIEPRVFGDARGMFIETWQANRYQKADIPGRFVQSNFVKSQQGVVRGLHYQLKHPQGKLIWVTRGQIFDVVVDHVFDDLKQFRVVWHRFRPSGEDPLDRRRRGGALSRGLRRHRLGQALVYRGSGQCLHPQREIGIPRGRKSGAEGCA